MRPRILKDNLILSEYQKEVLTGLLLGDGCIERTKNSQVARLKVGQNLRQSEFVQWLYGTFKDFVRTPPRLKQKVKGGKVYSELVFNTLTHKSFKSFYDLFYPEGKKIIPESINQQKINLTYNLVSERRQMVYKFIFQLKVLKYYKIY